MAVLHGPELFRLPQRSPERVFDRLPPLRGCAIDVSYRPRLTAWRGDLLSCSSRGSAVYAGSFLRRRQIVLDEQMLRTPHVLERIFVHEVFHFVWARLGNPLRYAWGDAMATELERGDRGELGWSAESLKMLLRPRDMEQRTLRWRGYICESFCDTAGWLYGSPGRYAEMTLGRAARSIRRRWMEEHISNRTLSL